MTMDVAPNTDASMCHLQYVTNTTRRFLKKKKKGTNWPPVFNHLKKILGCSA